MRFLALRFGAITIITVSRKRLGQPSVKGWPRCFSVRCAAMPCSAMHCVALLNSSIDQNDPVTPLVRMACPRCSARVRSVPHDSTAFACEPPRRVACRPANTLARGRPGCHRGLCRWWIRPAFGVRRLPLVLGQAMSARKSACSAIGSAATAGSGCMAGKVGCSSSPVSASALGVASSCALRVA